MRKLFYLLTDSRCLLCQKPLSFGEKNYGSLCGKCFKIFIPKKSELFCLKCGEVLKSGKICSKCSVDTKIIYYDSFRYIQSYSGAAMRLVKLHKQNDNHKVLDLYSAFLSKILNQNYPVYIVPDSLPGRIRKGKSCFSHQVARKLRKKGFNVINGVIKKSPFTKMQKLLDHKDRHDNAEKSFNLNKKTQKINANAAETIQLVTETIQLVDDIFTTGATINRCSKLLKDFGFKKVLAYSLFKAKFS